MIVIIRGPPGAGKTTLATRLAERLRTRGTAIDLLHSDEFARRTYERMYERVEREGGDWLQARVARAVSRPRRRVRRPRHREPRELSRA